MFLDLISTLLQLKTDNQPSIFVFLYNIKKGVPCNIGEPSQKLTTLNNLSPLINATSSDEYLVDNRLKVFSTINISMSLEDFGITILMLFFSKFYSLGQYPLFVYTFRCIAELEILERFLLTFNQNNIKLLPNLATHEVYGLKYQGHNFVDSKHLTVAAFNAIYSYMRSPEVTCEKFIECIKSLHINIIESFYIFTSITKNCKVINECHDLMHNNMNYTFQKPIKSLKYDGDFWFELPSKSIWFAYFQGKLKFSAYIGCDVKNSMSIFESIKCIIVGFIHENQIYPLIFEDPEIYGCWNKIIDFILKHDYNCAFRTGIPDLKNNKIYFVKNNVSAIFKLEK